MSLHDELENPNWNNLAVDHFHISRIMQREKLDLAPVSGTSAPSALETFLFIFFLTFTGLTDDLLIWHRSPALHHVSISGVHGATIRLAK